MASIIYNKIVAVPASGNKNPAAPKAADKLNLSLVESSIQIGAGGFFKVLDSAGASLVHAENTAFTVAQAATFSSDLTVTGNLTVNGTTTSLQTTNTQVKDNIIVLNDGEVGGGVTAGTSGISIDRGSADDAVILWDEATDKFNLKVGANFADLKINDLSAVGATLTGNLAAVDATLSGDLAAVDGTFSGNLAAVDATLSGDLAAVDATLSGDLAAVDATLSGDLAAVDATLSGNLAAVGGTFSGNIAAVDATLSGDLAAVDATLSGNIAAVDATLSGDLAAVDATLSGNLAAVGGTFSGNIAAVDATLSGDLAAVDATLSGNIAAVDATLSGDLAAVDATLSGDLAAVDATLSGNLAAVDGTFSGNIAAVDATLSGDIAAVDAAFSGAVSFTKSDDTLSIDTGTFAITETYALDVDGGAHFDGHALFAKTGGSLSRAGAAVTPDFMVSGKAVYSAEGGTSANPDLLVSGYSQFEGRFEVAAPAAASIAISGVADDAISFSTSSDGHIHLDSAKILKLSAAQGIATNHIALAGAVVSPGLALSVNAQGKFVAISAVAKNALVLGVSLATIESDESSKGKVAEFGKVEIQFETGASIAIGDMLYLSSIETGKVTNVVPTSEDSTAYMMGVALAAPAMGKVVMAMHRQFLYNN
jgi:putative sterol carrier protein